MTLTRRPPRLHHARLTAATHLLTAALPRLTEALTNLADAQPGYHTGGNTGGNTGSTTTGGHTDRTATLAIAPTDPATHDLHTAHTLATRIATDTLALTDIIRRWANPTTTWRNSLATEAARTHTDTTCRSCLRIGVMTPRRPEGGDLCRWCADTRRAIDRPGDIPTWLLELHHQGRRITTRDITNARNQMRPKR